MIASTLIFSNNHWIWLAITAVVLGLGLLIWSYRAAPSGPLRWLCISLKLFGVAVLAFCFLEPLWSSQRAKPGANLFAIVADNSQGLQIKDAGESRSRGDLLKETLDAQHAPWQQTLADNFEVRKYTVDARLQSSKDFAELAFDGPASNLGAALRTLAERYRGRPLAGILMFTDGNATDLKTAPVLDGLPPVYPVVVGRADAIRDIAIQQVRISQSAFEDSPVSVQADVAASGYRNESVVGQLLDPLGKVVAEQTARQQSSEPLAFRFQLKPEHHGLSFYRLRVRAKNEMAAAADEQATKEATLANNNAMVVVDRGRGPYRILYVAGRPNWEFKFLNRAIQEDDQLEMVGLMRVARREPKFNFLGRAGETSNPLYRGFGNQSPEEVQRYDQPVLVRLNTRDELELRTGFPRSPEDLYGYSAVIIDDVESEFFAPEQASLLQKFVSERGGGLLMLGGMECFQQGKYQRTPIGDMLPVYLDLAEDTTARTEVRLNLTREGLLQSWARLRDNEADEKTRIDAMTPFRVINHVSGVKPGASVIATASDANGKTWPALVVQRFGKGRSAALTIGDVWLWGFHDANAHKDMDKSWRQLVRWLVTDVPARVELTAQSQPENSGAMRLQVIARDEKFQPLDNASVTVEIQQVLAANPGPKPAATNQPANPASPLRLRAEPSETMPGVYEASYVPRATGAYRATAYVTNSVGAEVGRSEAGWGTDLAADEFRSLTPNVALLEDIARRTGGKVVPARNLEEFARSLPYQHSPVMEPWTMPAWHTPAIFGFALLCFVSEWGLRRWKGLP
jgi:uncharacterized membrane protein